MPGCDSPVLADPGKRRNEQALSLLLKLLELKFRVSEIQNTKL